MQKGKVIQFKNNTEKANVPGFYEVSCPCCENRFSIKKSIAHEMGFYEYGAVNCPKCEKTLNATYDPIADSIRTTDFEEWIASKRGAAYGTKV